MTPRPSINRLSDCDVAMPIEDFLKEPHVMWTHIDGPLMTWAGQLHWLTMRERIALWFGATTIEAVAQKQWPERCFWYAKAREATP
jgi:hypothetical protein